MPDISHRSAVSEAALAVERLGSVDAATLYMLTRIEMRLAEISEQITPFGQSAYNVRPVQIGTSPTIIVDKSSIVRRVRKVQLWVDSAVGGPAPTIRVGEAVEQSGSGGFRVIAGEMNDLGEVAPGVVLKAVSSVAIQAFVVEKS